MNPYSIILSADVPETSTLINLVHKTISYIDGIKIHLATLIYDGYHTIDDLIDSVGKKAFQDKVFILDLKIGDIGFLNSDDKFSGSNAKILEAVAKLMQKRKNVFVTVHGFPGPVSLRECIEIGHKYDIGILLIPYMSHKGSEVFFNAICDTKKSDKEIYKKYEMEFNLTYPQTISETILGLGELLGVDGYIGPSNNLDVLHSYRRISQKLIVSPGFGRQAGGVSFEQQFYSWAKEVGPNSAAIIGSMIYNASNCEEVARYIKNIRDAFVNDVSNSEPNWTVEGKVRKKKILHKSA